MNCKKKILGLSIATLSIFAACKKTDTMEQGLTNGLPKIITQDQALRTLPCLTNLPIQEQFPPYQTAVFPAVSAIGIPMSPLGKDEFDLTQADDSDAPIDPSYTREYDRNFLTPQTRAVLEKLDVDLDKIANNNDIMNNINEAPFLNAVDQAFVSAERGAANIKDDSQEGVKTTLDCIRATRAKIRPTYSHFASQACNFDETVTTADGGNVSAARFWKKLGRAVLRVAAAVVTTAVVVAAVVVVAKLTGGAGVAIAVKAAAKVLVKGVTIAGFKLKPVIATGAVAGLKNAYKNWDKPWGGASEFIFGIKTK
jgi:hypothetical protein